MTNFSIPTLLFFLPSNSLSKLPLSTSLCLYRCFAMLCPRCVCAIHLLVFSTVNTSATCPLGNEEHGRAGSTYLKCISLKCVLDMEKENSVLQKKQQASLNIYILRSSLCRNRSPVSQLLRSNSRLGLVSTSFLDQDLKTCFFWP